MTIKIKTYTVDGEVRVGIWVNGTFTEEIDTCSDFSAAEARKYLRDKYTNKLK